VRTLKTLQPGQKGTKELLARFGASLLCVRYGYDDLTRERRKTVELIIRRCPREMDPAHSLARRLAGQGPNGPTPRITLEAGRRQPASLAVPAGHPAARTGALRIHWRETELRRRVKAAGGWWDPEARLRRLRCDLVERLGLLHRVVRALGRQMWKPRGYTCPPWQWPGLAT
jgi:hypothetical protein